MTDLRILHVIASADPRGGGPIEGIIQQDRALSNDVPPRELVTLDPAGAAFLETLPFKVHALGSGTPLIERRNRIERFGFSWKLLPWLVSHCNSYDVIIVNGLWSFASVGFALTSPFIRTPYFLMSHGMLDPWFSRGRPALHFLKQVIWLFFEGASAAGARAVLFTSQDELLVSKRTFWGHPFVSRVVGYGTGDVPPSSLAQRDAFAKKVPRLEGRRYLLFLSRIHAKKGCDILIDAFASLAAEFPDVDLVMAGPDQEGLRDGLERRAAALRVSSRIHWAGMLSGDSKWGAFYSAEAFVLPSHQENFGIVVAEALACAVPVVISDRVNIWREVVDCGAGLAGSVSVDATTSNITNFLSLDESRRIAFSLAARKCFENHFNSRDAAYRMINTIQDLIPHPVPRDAF